VDELAHEQKASAPRKTTRASARTKKSASAGSARKPKDDAKAEPSAEVQDKELAAADGVADEATPPEDPVGQIIEKLKAHKCRTEKRLMNFIKSSHKTMSDADVLEVMDALKSRGYITVEDDGHVTWA